VTIGGDRKIYFSGEKRGFFRLRKKKLKIFARWECPFGLYNVEKGHFLDISKKKIAKNFSENGMSGLYKVALS
jgi:hypothetical protein